jgi:hypothetical protein
LSFSAIAAAGDLGARSRRDRNSRGTQGKRRRPASRRLGPGIALQEIDSSEAARGQRSAAMMFAFLLAFIGVAVIGTLDLIAG